MSRASDPYERAPSIGERLLFGVLIVLGLFVVFGAYAWCSPPPIRPVPASEITPSRDR